MRKLISLILCLILALIPIFCYAYNPYSSVNDSTSNMNICLQYMLNAEDFEILCDWIACRTDEYEYCCFYNIEESNASVIKYYRSGSNYNYQWLIDHYDISDFSFSNPYDYTYLGSSDGSLHSSTVDDYTYKLITKICILFFTILFAIYVFRIRKRDYL